MTAARIRDTMHLDRLLVSESLLPQLRANEKLDVLGEAEAIRFNADGNLVPDEVAQVR